MAIIQTEVATSEKIEENLWTKEKDLGIGNIHGIKESSMSKFILRVIKLEVGNMVALVRKMGKPQGEGIWNTVICRLGGQRGDRVLKTSKRITAEGAY